MLGLGVGITHSSVSKLLSIIKDGLQMWFDFESPQSYPNKLSNGDMEDNSGWIGFGSPDTQQQSQALFHSGSSSWHIAHSVAGSGIQNSPQFTITNGLSYEVEAYVYPLNGNSIKSGIEGSSAGRNTFRSVTAGQWNKISYTVNVTSDSSTAYISFFTNNSTEFYVDDVTIKEVSQFVAGKSTNINHGILKTGKALSFDGVNDYVDYGDISVNLKTLSFWINLDSTTEKVLQLTSSESVEVLSGTITLNGTWTGSNVYVNGTDTNTIAAPGWNRVVITVTSAIAVDDFEIGRIGSDYGDIVLSDIEIWDTTWAAADIAFDYDNPQHLALHRGASSLAVSNLKGYWHLSEGNASTVYDSSGEGNDATITGATRLNGESAIPQLALMDFNNDKIGSDVVTLVSDPNDIDGKDVLNRTIRKREHGMNFDGASVVEVLDADAISPGTGDFSLSCWIKNDTSISDAQNLISKDDQGLGNDGFGLSLLGSTNGILFRFDDGSGSHTDTTPSSDKSTLLTNGAWHHIVATADRSGNATLYIDKTSVGTTDISSKTGSIINADSRIYIGATGGINNSSDMIIDEVLYYNKALTLDEVTTNYDIGLSQHEAGSSFSTDFSSDYGF